MPNLVGTGLNQVPTNSMLGGLAYQDPEHASIKNLDLKNLSQINSEIADTAVDVFVYDTSKDSDGGAWRKRTQSTSWYNEALNTSTRGARKEFPAVAVIVAESDKVTIYDGDDPDMPMWMVFDRASSNMLFNGSSSGRKVEALNGHVALANSDALFACSFIDDRGYLLNASNTYESGNILARNSGYGYNITSTVNKLVSSVTNDVAMTVLPNAPVDPSTGLPIPTIAVATDGGTSVIKDDGTVVDLTGFSPVTTVHIDADNVIGTSNSGSPSHDFIFKTHIPPSDEAFTGGITAGSKNYYMNSNSGTIPLLRDLDMSDSTYDSKDDVVYRGGNAGFDIIRAGVNYSQTHSNPSIAYISKDYNTGYMVGDIRGAFLSDTDATDSVAAYYDDFANNDKGWGFVNTSITGGNMVITQQGSARSTDGDALNGISTGTKLFFTFTVSGSGTGSVIFDDDGAGAGVGGTTNYGSFNSTGLKTFTATKTASNRIRIMRTSGSNDYEINFLNISTEEFDRSVNNNGLAVSGTITKTPVATGADLVGYSPSAAGSYLLHPVGATGINWASTWSLSFWCTNSAKISIEYTNTSGYNNTVFLISVSPTSVSLRSKVGNWYQTLSSITNSGWNQFVASYNGSGTLSFYKNGKLYNSYSGSPTNQTAYISLFTNTYNNTNALSDNVNVDSNISLIRVSASVPSPEQVNKIYEDEKVLFQENAKCTLYGSSDAVTALAYDEDTDLLHVGTSAGRSEFQGLRRINNTTDAVTTAISASNGLVAEQ